MKITDQQLSAFLDAELPEAEMEQIRDRLAQDDILAERLANLAQVDAVLNQEYRAIDAVPYSQGLTQVLAQAEQALAGQTQTTTTNNEQTKNNEQVNSNVVELPLWRRLRESIQQHAAAAAVAALFIGVGIGHYTPQSQSDTWQQVSAALDTVPSGQQVTIGTQQLQPQASFASQSGDYCRQFILTGKQQQQVSIACKTAQDWQLTASVYQAPQQQGTYQTATNPALLESTIDQLIDGGFLNQQQEKQAIINKWSSKTQ